MGNDIETKVDPFGPRENSPIEKQGSQDKNPDESSVQINTKPQPIVEEEEQHMLLQWIGWVRRDSAIKILKSQAKRCRPLIDESLDSNYYEPENKGSKSSFESLPSPPPSTRNYSCLSAQGKKATTKSLRPRSRKFKCLPK